MSVLSSLNYFRQLPSNLLSDSQEFTGSQKKSLFKKMVDRVEIEAHSFCNRKCSFCANSFLDRFQVRERFDPEKYETLLADLKSINYDQTLRFARYSEPLADREILSYIAKARSYLPEAKIEVITNGDYLTTRYLEELSAAGLNHIWVSIYPDAVKWTLDSAISVIEKLGKSLDLTLQCRFRAPHQIQFSSRFDNIGLIFSAVDLISAGHDRAGSLGHLTKEGFARTSPCYMPFRNLHLDWNGRVVLCCNTRSDDPEHEKYTFGAIKNREDIFDIFFNNHFQQWRRELIRNGEKPAPCSTCTQKDKEYSSVGHSIDNYIVKKFVRAD